MEISYNGAASFIIAVITIAYLFNSDLSDCKILKVALELVASGCLIGAVLKAVGVL